MYFIIKNALCKEDWANNPRTGTASSSPLCWSLEVSRRRPPPNECLPCAKGGVALATEGL